MNDLTFWKRTAFGSMVLTAAASVLCWLAITQFRERVEFLKEHQTIVYKVDSMGSAQIGTVTAKSKAGGKYTMALGNFVYEVTKEQYERVSVGDRVIGYLKQRGMGNNEVK